MKYVIAFLIAFGGVGLVFADSEIMILKNGQVLTKGGGWSVSDIKVTDEAKRYPAFVSKAFSNPNRGIIAKEVLINTIVSNLFSAEKTIVHTIVKYDFDDNLIDSEYRTHKDLIPLSFPAFWLLMMAVIIFILFTKDCDVMTRMISFIVLCFLVALSVVSSLDILKEQQLLFIFVTMLILGSTWFAVGVGHERIRSAAVISFVLMLLLARIFYEPLF